MELKTIIFSYNRPAQLDLLLRSMKRFTDFTDIYVSYMHEPSYREGYKRVIKENPDVRFEYRKKNLKYYVQKALQSPLTVFLCDDEVFVAKVSQNDKQFKTFKKYDDILCLALRMGRNVDYCMSNHNWIKVPPIDKNGVWNWKALVEYKRSSDGLHINYESDWGYPMSVAGHVFRTEDLKQILKPLKFDNPNQLEDGMCHFISPRNLAVCYDSQRMVEAMLEKEQIIELNKEFMQGKIIDLEYIVKQELHCPQQGSHLARQILFHLSSLS